MTRRLKPMVASYTGEVYTAVNQYLNEDVLDLIAAVAESAIDDSKIRREVFEELEEMHVLTKEAELVRLDTAVFLREDIERVQNTVKPLAQELAEQILACCGDAFLNTPPEATIFLAGIVGLVQGLGKALKEKQIGIDWSRYDGRYARTKVDFDEVCDAYHAVGPDYLNKTVLQGEGYTAVFIGPGGKSFQSLAFDISGPPQSKAYAAHVTRYLVDVYARLVIGEVENEALRAAGELANLFGDDGARSVVITNEIVRSQEKAIRSIADIAATYYADRLPVLYTLLQSTTSGRQGVPAANMMLNLWRYIRKLTAQELYAAGFFTDDIPERGTLTIFYANDTTLIRELLL